VRAQWNVLGGIATWRGRTGWSAPFWRSIVCVRVVIVISLSMLMRAAPSAGMTGDRDRMWTFFHRAREPVESR